VGESLGWLLRGLSPLDHRLKRLPGDVMCGLLVPYQAAEADPSQLFLCGEGALAAYLAYGAETLGGIPVAGIQPSGAGPVRPAWPPLHSERPPAEASVWVVPGASGPGRTWQLRPRQA
jgi:hypothetical protein